MSQQPIKDIREILKCAGVILDGESIVLTRENVLVIRELDKLLCEEGVVQRFTREFTRYCEDEERFRKALSPTLLKKTLAENSDEVKVRSDCLIRILLNIGNLQKHIFDLLLETMTTHAAEDATDTTYLRLLLNPMKYLSFIKEPKVLAEKLLDILEIATHPSQLEIINSLQEIIPDSEYDTIAKELVKLLERNTHLTASIIDCLNCLNLSSDILNHVHDYVLNNLINRSSVELFPIIYDFLLADNKTLPNTLSIYRNSLDTIVGEKSTEEDTISNKVIIFDKLRASAFSKGVFEAWTNVIVNVRNFNSEQKPIDVLILFMLHSVGRKRDVEAIFKKLVKSGALKITFLDDLFERYVIFQILHDYLHSIIEISSSLLRQNDGLLVDFASHTFKLLFVSDYVKHNQRQDILYNLTVLMSYNHAKIVGSVLKILLDLAEDSKLQNHVLQLMKLLEKVDTFELKNIWQMMKLLCCLTCKEDADAALASLKDELHMLTRKQLSSPKKQVRKQGIISAIMMAKYMSMTEEDQSDIVFDSESSLTIDDLPNGRTRDSASLLELVGTCSSSTVELMGTYYDQLSVMISSPARFEKNFMKWLKDSVTQDFLDVYIAESLSVESIDDVSLNINYLLNTAEEVDVDVVVNIGEMTMKSSHELSSVVLLPAHFRLLRLLHFKENDEGLKSINALLGCGVIMPLVDDLNSYDTQQLKQVNDCIFGCINWFRELVSAFVTQRDKKLQLKVIERVKQLTELEKLLQEGMKRTSEHKLPVSYFYNTVQPIIHSPSKESKAPRPRKRARVDEGASNMNDTTTSTQLTQAKKSSWTKKQQQDVCYNFRELDIDVMFLLKYPLKDFTTQEDFGGTQQISIELTTFQYILKDCVTKLKLVIKNKGDDLSNFNIADPTDLIKAHIKLLPKIDKHLNVICENIRKLLDRTDNVHDHFEMFTDDSANLKSSFNCILEYLSLIFGWPGFLQKKNLSLLKECLGNMRKETPSQLQSSNLLMKELVVRLYSYRDYCLLLPSGVHLVTLMQNISMISGNNLEIKKKITLTSDSMLKRKWYKANGDCEGGKLAFESIDVLLKAYLAEANVNTVYGLVGTLKNQVAELKAKDDVLPMFCSVNKTSFHVLFRNVCSVLPEKVKAEVTSLSNNEHMTLWRTTAITMQGLMGIVKVQESKSNLAIFLKKSIRVLKVFLSHGIPILEIMLRSKPDEVVEILKTLQTTTRFLHHLCCYSKLMKDACLMSNVPQFRQVLEEFVFRVKAALAANNCSEAFWMGILRNRDLQGEDIPSQSSNNSGDTNDADDRDEELPPDEDGDSDEDNIDNISLSDVFD